MFKLYVMKKIGSMSRLSVQAQCAWSIWYTLVGGGDKIWKSKFEKSNIHLTFHGYVETLFILLVPHFFWKKNPTRAKKPILSNFHRFCLENIHLKSLHPFFLILKAF